MCNHNLLLQCNRCLLAKAVLGCSALQTWHLLCQRNVGIRHMMLQQGIDQTQIRVSGIVPKPWLASAAKLWKFISAVVALASSGLVTFVWSKTIDSSGQKTIHTLPSSSEESQCTFTSVQNRSRAPDRGHQRQRKHPKMAMVRTEALRARGFPDCQKRFQQRGQQGGQWDSRQHL